MTSPNEQDREDREAREWADEELEEAIAAARAEGYTRGLEDAARAVEAEQELPGRPPFRTVAKMFFLGPEESARVMVRTTKKACAAAIRALSSEPTEGPR